MLGIEGPCVFCGEQVLEGQGTWQLMVEYDGISPQGFVKKRPGDKRIWWHSVCHLPPKTKP